MSTSYLDLLESARSIGKINDTEAMRRATASRAYYAAYHAAKCYHNRLPSPGSLAYARGGMHEVLFTQLRTPTVKDESAKFESIAMGNLLMAAHGIRVRADYRLEETFPLVAGLDLLDKAHIISEALKSSDLRLGALPR